MSNIGERLHELRKSKKLTQYELADKLGCSHQAISRYEKNENLDKVYDFIKICQFFDDDMYYLITGSKYNGKEISQQDQQILSAYHNLNNSDKQKIVDFILEIGEYDAAKMMVPEPSIIYRFPVYEQQAAAGAGKYGREGKYHMKDLKISNLSNQAVFGVEISGNSMENKKDINGGIRDNATVLLNPNFDELNLEGRVVVFKINSTNEVLCKRYFKEESTIGFISDNDECSSLDKHLNTGEYTIIGEVVNVINP